MNEQHIYELQYQAWIKRHLRKILLSAFLIIALGFAYEARTYIQSSTQQQAQKLFEHYLDSPHTDIVTKLKSNYPKQIQTHLVLFLEAKEAYNNHNIEQAINYLDFVYKNSEEQGIQKIAAYRLAHLYLQKQDMPMARAVLEPLDDDAYSELQLALTIQDPQERMEKLNHAFSISDSPYLNKMIATAHNDIIEP